MEVSHLSPLVVGVLTMVVPTISLAVLTYIARKVKTIAATPERVEALEATVQRIDAENRKAHGDLWTELRSISRRY